jgi:hypothetical protein
MRYDFDINGRCCRRFVMVAKPSVAGCLVLMLLSSPCFAETEPTLEDIRAAMSVAQGDFRQLLNGLAWRVNHRISPETKASIPFNNTYSPAELQAALVKAASIEKGGCVPQHTWRPQAAG